MSKYDVVLSNGRVIDPETFVDATMNVGIKGESIAAVSETPLEGKEVIDVSGMIVSPGFIDMHAHGQDIPSNRMQAFDGCTTALDLESGVLPVCSSCP
jgi:N-acyl-D-glutamate deacylase